MSDESGAVDVKSIIVGAGFAGIGAAVRLLQSGEDDFVVLERAEQLGGTWRDNVYPGCRCDVPSHLYSFSSRSTRTGTAPTPTRPRSGPTSRRPPSASVSSPTSAFSHRVAGGALGRAAGRVGAHDRSRPASRGPFLIGATGSLAEPEHPGDPGPATSFDGTGDALGPLGPFAALRRAAGRRHRDRRVGHPDRRRPSSPRSRTSSVFQRTPGWVLPHPVRDVRPMGAPAVPALPAGPAARARRHLLAARAAWSSRRSPSTTGSALALERQVRRHLGPPGPRPRAAGASSAPTTSSDASGCCRRTTSTRRSANPTSSSSPSRSPGSSPRGSSPLTAASTALDVDRVRDRLPGERQPDGRAHRRARGGHRLAEAFAGDLPSYLGTTFPYFPNFFMLTGPNTGTGHTSQVFMIECQLHYVLDALDFLGDGRRRRRRGARAGGRRPSRRRGASGRSAGDGLGVGLRQLVPERGGRNVAMWPDYTFVYRRRTRRFDADRLCHRPPLPTRTGPAQRASGASA